MYTDNCDAILDSFEKPEKAVRAREVVEGTGVDKKEIQKAMNNLKGKEGKNIIQKDGLTKKAPYPFG